MPFPSNVEIAVPSRITRSRTAAVLSYVVLPLILLAVSVIFRTVALKKFGAMYDEQITRAVAENIWKGDLRNNWKYAANMPQEFRIDCYNFSPYMYADALVAGPHAAYAIHTAHAIYRERLFSAVLGTLAIILFYWLALHVFGFMAGIAALAIMSVFPLLVQDAHFARPEAFLLFLCGIVYVCSVMLIDAARPLLWLAGASFCCGLMIACKISLPPMAAVPLILLAARKRLSLRSVTLWAVMCFAGFFIGVADGVLHPAAFWRGVEFLRSEYSGDFPPYSLLDHKYSFPLLLPYFWQTLGPVCCLSALAGTAVLLWQREYIQLAYIAAPVWLYVLYFGFHRVFIERNLSHIAPLIAILAGLGISWLVCLAPRPFRVPVFAVVLFLCVLKPALVSYKLVYLALRVSPQERARTYEQQISSREGLPIEEVSELVSSTDVAREVALAKSSADDVIITIRDYHDGYTRRARHELQKQVRTRDVGFFPSLFPNFSASTLLTYHSPNLRYIRLFAPDSRVMAGQTFVSWRMVKGTLPLRPVLSNSWVINGVDPGAPVPSDKDELFGSYTPAGRDANRGTIKLGPFGVHRPLSIGIPLITGPDQTRLSVTVINHDTGAAIAELRPPPNVPRWAIWRADILPTLASQFDVIAKDEGDRWGEWLAIGYPLQLR